MSETNDKNHSNLRVTIILPTLNEIDGLRWFMPRLKKEWYDELIVSDGGSTDGTLEYCRLHNYKVLMQSDKGLANAYDDAFKSSSNDIFITVTPDGNSLPELIPQLVEKILEGNDMVIASRYLDGARSYDDDAITALGNRMFTFIINVLFRAHYTDTLVAYRAYRREAIEKMDLEHRFKHKWLSRIVFDRDSWETASSIRAKKLKLKVCEIPGDEPLRIGGKRKMSIIKNGLGIVAQIAYELLTPGVIHNSKKPGEEK